MNCAQARRWLDPYMDGELDLEQALALEQHLASCAECSAALASRRALGTALREKLDYHRAPLALQRAVRRTQQPRGLGTAPQWLRLAASFLLVAALSSGATYYATLGGSGGDAIPDEIFASHMRAAQSENRLIDVASADEHTVKPWLDARLDFAPPVKDLSAQGFALIGGRIDYIGGQRAAALIYRLRKHEVTLFIWPSDGPARPIATSPRRGETLAHWSDGAMRYWAISDMPASDLIAFCRDFAVAQSVPERRE